LARAFALVAPPPRGSSSAPSARAPARCAALVGVAGQLEGTTSRTKSPSTRRSPTFKAWEKLGGVGWWWCEVV
jgi:hypothetical protein